MNEELIISGRNNLLIDPHLHIWHWPIALDLFLGGLSAGILFFAALFYILGKENKYPAAVRIVPLFVPVLLIVCFTALFYDLRHKAFFWQLYTTVKLQSPMSWGAWTLTMTFIGSVVWAVLHIRDQFPRFNLKYKWLKDTETFLAGNKLTIAWCLIFLSVALGVYTGILLSAFNARPLWNTAVLGPLFLTSGLAAGAASVLQFARSPEESNLFKKLTVILLGVELFLIIHMFMGFLAGTQVQIEAAELFLGGQYTMVFWIFIVFLGIIMPGVLSIMNLRGVNIPTVIPVVLILLGGFLFRFVFVYAGQLSRWLY
ncbi:MAG: polysulfide reductase NrfD [Bacteroidales bacterium]|nr:polysulfide reductase NrfD [Bacteroidales bacterium]TFH49903.1 MAG: nitrite reductase [Bacteroidia bacterium]